MDPKEADRTEAGASMEEASNADSGFEEENGEPASDLFMCYVCLDLIYKPVVLECGHMSCFWCIHRSMNGWRDSSCVVCRQEYKYFPGICELLHRLLLKMEPTAYKRRAKEVFEEEKKANCFSPQFVECFEGEPGTNHVESSPGKPTTAIGNEVSVADVLCHGCKELLFRPLVLNCGHVYCEACAMVWIGDSIKCPTCQVLHPGVLPKTCLKFDEFLAKEFPEQYMLQMMNCNLERKDYQNEASPSCAPALQTPSKKEKVPFYLNGYIILNDEDLAHAHLGVGCDACGMYPIIGKRYKCKDCTEAIGFDLCEACYDTPSKRPGRFNQRHTPDHKFEIDETCVMFC